VTVLSPENNRTGSLRDEWAAIKTDAATIWEEKCEEIKRWKIRVSMSAWRTKKRIKRAWRREW